MTGKPETVSSSHNAKLIEQLGYDSRYSRALAQRVLETRNECEREITEMQQIVQKLHPTPDYRVYNACIKSARYFCHSEGDLSTLTCALYKMHESSGCFTVDADGQIVAADPSAQIPKVSDFTPVIESTEVIRLPNNHPATRLYSLAQRIEDIRPSLGYAVVLLWAEGVNEQIGDLQELFNQ